MSAPQPAESDLFLPPPIHPGQHRLAAGWLWLGVAAITGAGLFAILLVAARAPAIQALTPGVDLFRLALVTHVDLSVFVWFLAMAALFTVLASGNQPIANRMALHLAGLGALIVACGPLTGGEPSLNNYIPVIQHPVFLGGLLLFAVGVAVQVLMRLPAILRLQRQSVFGTGTAVVAAGIVSALLVFLVDTFALPFGRIGPADFERLFWGAGHTLQFAYAELVLITWLWLAAATGSPAAGSAATHRWWLAAGVLPIVGALVLGLGWPSESAWRYAAFTELMRWGGLLPALPVGGLLLVGMVRHRASAQKRDPSRIALIGSLLLFVVGGVLGFLLSGSDTRVPAHYHGSIVGVTLALMGAAYQLLPRLGFGAVTGRLAYAQPWCYAGGQLLHVTGLALLGLAGGARKTVASGEALSGLELAARGVMGAGGLIAVVGGVLFVVVMLRQLLRRRPG